MPASFEERSAQRGALRLSMAWAQSMYRARQQAGKPTGTQPVPQAGRHARALEIRQQVSELVRDMAAAASGQQALFAAPGAASRRTRPPRPPGRCTA